MIEKLLNDSTQHFDPRIQQAIIGILAFSSIVIALRKAFGGLGYRRDYQSLIENATRCIEASEPGSVARKAYETVRENLMVKSIAGVHVTGESQDCLLKLLGEKDTRWGPREIGRALEHLEVVDERYVLQNHWSDHLTKYLSRTFSILMGGVVLVLLGMSPVVLGSANFVTWAIILLISLFLFVLYIRMGLPLKVATQIAASQSAENR